MLGKSPMRPSGPAGFSVIELVVTLAIAGFVVALAMPAINEWIQGGQIRTAAESVKNGLELARAEAVKANSPVSFTLDNSGMVGGTGWTVLNVRTAAVIQTRPDREGSQQVVLTATPDLSTTVTFSGLGRRQVANADGTPVMTMIGASNPSVASPRALNVTISTGGEIRMCDPLVTDSGDPRRC